MKASKHVTITPYGNQKENKARMVVEKELTIYTVLEIKENFLDAINQYNELDVQIKNVENIDLSFIQLIESLRKTAEEYDKKISISAELVDETQTLVDNAGFDPILRT
ncbi:MAG TPA: STAS domain-containing protein [Bacteroidales bacterium]|nr:STAS domain-containing protein [Bacteroidales bacterium]